MGGGHKSLEHTDVDALFSKNQHLRWILIDEVGMISDSLLGAFEKHVTDAAKQTRYSYRADKSLRLFGGYNLLAFGDLYQIPPIPASAALFIPSTEGKTQQERAALELFWSNDRAKSLNAFWELQIKKRVLDDVWYTKLLGECRFGALSDESYNCCWGCQRCMLDAGLSSTRMVATLCVADTYTKSGES